MATRDSTTPTAGVVYQISPRPTILLKARWAALCLRPLLRASPWRHMLSGPRLPLIRIWRGDLRGCKSIVVAVLCACVAAIATGCVSKQRPGGTSGTFPFGQVDMPFDYVNQLGRGHPAHTVMPSYLVLGSRHRTVAAQRQFSQRGGNALVLTTNGLAVTNAHVAQLLSSSLIVMTPQGVRLHTQIIGFSPHYDLAVIQVPPYAHMRPLIPGDPDQLHPGDTLYAMGISRQAKTFAEARVVDPRCTAPHPITKKQRALITIQSSTITHGYSGGPLFTRDGKVVGMIVGILKSGICGKQIFAIRIDEILRETQRIWHDFYEKYSASRHTPLMHHATLPFRPRGNSPQG